MSPPSTTKERIFDAAEAIMLEKSFHSVGLNEILKAVQVPKGSFYHHFESKDQFGIEMLRHYVDAATAYKKRMLLSDELEADPRQRMLTFFESSIAKFMENEGKCPCLVIKLASEVTDLNDGMRQVLADGYKEWNRITATLIAEGLGEKFPPLRSGSKQRRLLDRRSLDRCRPTCRHPPQRRAIEDNARLHFPKSHSSSQVNFNFSA